MGFYDSESKTVKQYNTDGSVSQFSRKGWAEKKMVDTETRLEQIDRKWGIPDIPEKRMTLTTNSKGKYAPRVRGASFSENLLDSVDVNAKRSKLPFDTSLAIVLKESTGGRGNRAVGHSPYLWLNTKYPADNKGLVWGEPEIDYTGMQSPTLLVSDWQQYDSPYARYLYDSNLNALKRERSEDDYEENFNGSVKHGNRFEIKD